MTEEQLKLFVEKQTQIMIDLTIRLHALESIIIEKGLISSEEFEKSANKHAEILLNKVKAVSNYEDLLKENNIESSTASAS